MATTPPPPARLRTPPTPRHGPKFDTHEPYSPRRSSRINAKRDAISSLNEIKSSPNAHSTPTSSSAARTSRKVSFPPRSSQTFSPPSSPISPNARALTPKRRSPFRSAASASKQLRQGRSSTEPESDLDLNNLQGLREANRGPLSMLPTPRKTPNKRKIHSSTQIGSTARALFSQRPLTVEDAMPSPRKHRSRSRLDIAMNGFGDISGNENDTIEIYTDSKERIPDDDEVDDNPFMTKRTSRSKAANGDTATSKPKSSKGITKQMDEAIKNDEGVVYVFRGKKYLRKFEDAEEDTDNLEDADELGHSDLVHQAGAAAQKRFTRSAITPRLLFPPKEPTPERLLEEEAATDIEAAEPVTASEDEDAIVTPVKHRFKPATLTPPTTGHHKAGKRRRITPESSPLGPEAPDHLPSPISHRKRSTLFDTWPTAKPGLRGASAKREGEDLGHFAGSAGKRVKES